MNASTGLSRLPLQSLVEPLEVGQHCYVNWRNGNFQLAEIVDVRSVNRSSNDNSEYCYEYYIHYSSFDRRLDEWVTIHKIDVNKVPPNGLIPDISDDESENYHQRRRNKRKFSGNILPKYINCNGSAVSKNFRVKENKPYLSKDHISNIKNILTIEIGRYEIDAWYYSPYPEDYIDCSKLLICEFCLKYMRKPGTLNAHKNQCQQRSPPGREIYREENLSVFEIDGKISKCYCQNLCLLSKLFLDHKTLYFDVEPFVFYALCEVDQDGAHIVGYFSKEKSSEENYNVACILTFPPFQRKGYGKFLISLSYELSKKDGAAGTPEKPLSDLGKLSYKSYWSYAVIKLLAEHTSTLNIKEISRLTGIKIEDVVSTLKSLNLIRVVKGQHILYLSEEILSRLHKKVCSTKIRLAREEFFVCEPKSPKSK